MIPSPASKSPPADLISEAARLFLELTKRLPLLKSGTENSYDGFRSVGRWGIFYPKSNSHNGHRQQQNLEDFPNLRRWFETVRDSSRLGRRASPIRTAPR